MVGGGESVGGDVGLVLRGDVGGARIAYEGYWMSGRC